MNQVIGLDEIGRLQCYFSSKTAAFVLQPVHLAVPSPPYNVLLIDSGRLCFAAAKLGLRKFRLGKRAIHADFRFHSVLVFSNSFFAESA